MQSLLMTYGVKEVKTKQKNEVSWKKLAKQR